MAGIPEAAEPTGEAYRSAVSMLLPYLLSWRTRLTAVEQVRESARLRSVGFGVCECVLRSCKPR